MRISRKLRHRMKFEAKIDEEQLRWAYLFWYRHYAHKKVDNDVEKLFTLESAEFPGRSWLREVREAQLLSREEVSKRAGLSISSFQQFELSEAKGKISLLTLQKAAQALDCELVYGLRSKDGKKFSVLIWEKILEHSIESPWVVNKPQHLKGISLASVVRRKQRDSKFRRRQNWTERKN